MDIDFRDVILTADDKPLYHRHDTYEIDYYLESDSEVFVNESRYCPHSEYLVFIPPYTVHGVIYKSGTKYARYCLYFEPDQIAGLIRAAEGDYLLERLINSKESAVNIGLTDKSKTDITFARLLKTFQSQRQNDTDANRLRSKLALATAITEIMDCFYAAETKKNELQMGEQAKNIKDFIDENYMNPISLDLLAKEFYMSGFSVCHFFKKATGTTMVNYLNEVRVRHALDMLQNKKTSIIEVCFNCGFNNLQHFYRVFKKATNVTPGYFRK